MKSLIVGKNSFLSKNLNIKNSIKISHQDIENLNLNEFDRLILISFPPEYKEKKENDFFFEKKLLDKFTGKKIVYFSTQKVYPYTLNCKEDDFLLPDSHYAENKLDIENLIANRTKNYQIFRISSVFSDNNFSKFSFFSQLKNNWNLNNEINFDISLKSIKDFITINSLNFILDKIIYTENYNIYNVGSKYGVSIIEILNTIFNHKLPVNIKQDKNLIKSRTLDNSKICQLLKIDDKIIHEETNKQISNLKL